MFSPISSSPRRCQPFHRAMPWTSSKAIARHGCIGLDHFSLGIRWGIRDMLHLALYQHCTMTLAASCTCFFWQPDGHSGAASNVFIFNWLIQVCFPNFNIFKNSENEFQLPSSASSLAASTKGSTAAPCALRRSFWCVEIQIWKRVPKNRIFLEVERAGEGPGPGRLMLSALLWSKPAVCTGHHYQECYWVVKPHPIHIYCISILYPSISISTLLYSTPPFYSILLYSIVSNWP